jgi:hypothetical protein
MRTTLIDCTEECTINHKTARATRGVRQMKRLIEEGCHYMYTGQFTVHCEKIAGVGLGREVRFAPDRFCADGEFAD